MGEVISLSYTLVSGTDVSSACPNVLHKIIKYSDRNSSIIHQQNTKISMSLNYVHIHVEFLN
jgi:hypothetical protein